MKLILMFSSGEVWFWCCFFRSTVSGGGFWKFKRIMCLFQTVYYTRIGNPLKLEHVKESFVYWFVLLIKKSYLSSSEGHRTTMHQNWAQRIGYHWITIKSSSLVLQGKVDTQILQMLQKKQIRERCHQIRTVSKRKIKTGVKAFAAGTRQGHPRICGNTSRPQQERTSEVAWCGFSCMDRRTTGRPNPVHVRSDTATGFPLDTVCCFAVNFKLLCHFHSKTMFISKHAKNWRSQTQQPQTQNPESLRAQKEGAKTRAKLVSQLEDRSSLISLMTLSASKVISIIFETSKSSNLNDFIDDDKKQSELNRPLMD